MNSHRRKFVLRLVNGKERCLPLVMGGVEGGSERVIQSSFEERLVKLGLVESGRTTSFGLPIFFAHDPEPLDVS
jgi:hypothetical protein